MFCGEGVVFWLNFFPGLMVKFELTIRSLMVKFKKGERNKPGCTRHVSENV